MKSPWQSSLDRALELHHQGNHKEALAEYQALLRVWPDCVDAWQLQGFLHLQNTDYAAALTCYEEALARQAQPAYRLYRGECLFHLGRHAEARPDLESVLSDPRMVGEASFYLGLVYFREDRREEAVALLGRAITAADARPDRVEMFVQLLRERCPPEQTLDILERLRRDSPAHPGPAYARAVFLQDESRHEEALPDWEAASAAWPDEPEVHYRKGRTLREMRRLPEAIVAFQRAAQLQPRHKNALNYLAMCLADGDRLNEAIAIHAEALRVDPDFVPSLNNAASCLVRQGKADQALPLYQRIIELFPDNLAFLSNWLFTLNYEENCDPKKLSREHRRFGEKADALPCPPLPPWRQRSAGGPLRVGLVSGDFRQHPILSWLLGWLPWLDRRRIELVAVCNNTRDDGATDSLKPLFGEWLDVRKLDMKEKAAVLRQAGLDVLVDLSGHTGANLMPVFSWRCAPLQLTMLGYPNTTGLRQMDYRLTDRWADPEGLTDDYYTETLYRMPRCAWCFAPPKDSPPAERQTEDALVFGCFNNLAKIQPNMFRLWCRLLHLLPDSKFLIKSHGLQDPFLHRYYLKKFAAEGIGPERLILVGRTRGLREHLAYYQKVDVALDTFPYHGTTTTAEALWMGVPTVSLLGTDHRSRVGLSLLTAAGHPEWAVTEEEAFLETACQLGEVCRRRAFDRVSWRQSLLASALCDGPGYASSWTASLEELAARNKPKSGMHCLGTPLGCP